MCDYPLLFVSLTFLAVSLPPRFSVALVYHDHCDCLHVSDIKYSRRRDLELSHLDHLFK